MQRARGFTLLEVMLVLLLVGILASAVVINFSGNSPEQRLEKEVLRFSQVFQFIADSAQLRQQEWGLVVAAGQYAFVYYQADGWQWAQQPAAAKAYTLPEGITLTVELEGLPGEEQSLLSQLEWEYADEGLATSPEASSPPTLPQVFILSSGEVSPFRLTFSTEQSLSSVQVTLGTDFSLPLQRYSEAD
ncbi:MAG: type II secretion system minor pseudopilin GspH [Alishewanella agri]|nr:type II secretion system minor pseudopilin GspH [Alishewanella agri]